MKFAVAFSGGKDCTLALDKMIREGHEPVGLIMCMNEDGTSVMHNVRAEIMKRYEAALGIPVIQYETDDFRKYDDICAAIEKAKALGAEALVTGDIALWSVRNWNQSVCDRMGVQLICPLWEIDRETCLHELLRLGYKAVVTAIWAHSIPTSFLGRILDEEMIEELKQYRIDITGENGEFHTMTVDGPIFKAPLSLSLTGSVLTSYQNEYSEIQ